MSLQTIDMIRSADLIIRRLLAVKSGESVAIVCDPQTEMAMALALAGVVEAVGAEYTIMIMPTRSKERGNDLTAIIEKGLEAADCMVGLTRASGAPTYSSAVKALYKRKSLRTISMVFRDVENYTHGGALADYDALYQDGQKLADRWSAGGIMHITTASGTDIRAPVAGEDVVIECGFATEPGQEAAFSDGEVSSRPHEGTAEGVIVVDGPICYLGLPADPIHIYVEKGKITRIEGESPQANELRRIVATIKNADNIAEFGIGLNPDCQRNGDFEEEKKARGLVHIAIGDNVFYGGQTKSPVHMDMVLYEPTVWLDDQILVDQGKVWLDF